MATSWKKKCFFYMSLILFFSNCGPVIGYDSAPIVSTRSGMVKGKLIQVKESTSGVFAFLGVPYASPPVRFASPQPPTSWTEIRNATTYPPLCLQNLTETKVFSEYYFGKYPELTSSEDCLYLNIYSPANAFSDQVSRPVMVWIHGGGFQLGGASLFDGSSLAAFGNVVVVIIQYRLGILGFLSTGDSQALGNLGLYDQLAALQWVQDNIKGFGGNPKSVTLFGESAGAMSVSIHALSPLSAGLFHRIISQSGVILHSTFLDRNPKLKAQKLAVMANCSSTDSTSIVECFKNKTIKEIIKISPCMLCELAMTPVIDGNLLPKDPLELLSAKTFNNVAYLLGVNNQEGGWIIPQYMLSPGWENGVSKQTAMVIAATFLNKLNIREEALKMIEDEYFMNIDYFSGSDTSYDVRDMLIELISDFNFIIPTIKTARLFRDAGKSVYLYEFQHRPSFYGDRRPPFVKADHMDDIGFVFGAPYCTESIVMLENTTDDEKLLSKTIMAYWTNFAKNGNPNDDTHLKWPVYKLDEAYMGLSLSQYVGNELSKDKMSFWTKVLNMKNGNPNNSAATINNDNILNLLLIIPTLFFMFLINISST
ncbi:carboxylesterase 5A-like [Erpetoichthys calabaricus]|uniref:carboxylesterase 5A-like n=1 Tax=Erpetoichthys calabaricus TaxID=27687 RepID=UPI0022344A5D|nr:carboxylesterase 5A-like [Erpetoichthys calabaricus]